MSGAGLPQPRDVGYGARRGLATNEAPGIDGRKT
jgi:hypothetical protein